MSIENSIELLIKQAEEQKKELLIQIDYLLSKKFVYLLCCYANV